MKLSDFDYHLPPELIATEPANPRDSARLLVLHKDGGAMEHEIFRDVIDYLRTGDILVLNDSRVIPARLPARRILESGLPSETGGEVFLCARHPDAERETWQCLVKGRARAGDRYKVADDLEAVVLEANEDGTRQVAFNLRGDRFMDAIAKYGQVPLPPYIEKRRRALGEAPLEAADSREYQTVYADDAKLGSVAAPTAGLHFTPELLAQIKNKGVEIIYVTLHVGLGTFLPVKIEALEGHRMHAEWVQIQASSIAALQTAKMRGGRVVACGTTSLRALESAWLALEKGELSAGQAYGAWTDIFIYPPYRFRVVDALITNFHLPKSTLLMLVSAFASPRHRLMDGMDNIAGAYREAIKKHYRFYSYGDAMLVI